jgi:hypothetical protein
VDHVEEGWAYLIETSQTCVGVYRSNDVEARGGDVHVAAEMTRAHNLKKREYRTHVDAWNPKHDETPACTVYLSLKQIEDISF